MKRIAIAIFMVLMWTSMAQSYARTSTLVIAASNSIDKTNADYICNGTTDATTIQAAINAISGSSVGKGKITFMEGDYYINTTLNGASGITFEGMGAGVSNADTPIPVTTFHLSGTATTMFTFNGGTTHSIRNVTFKNMAFTAGAIQTSKTIMNLIFCREMTFDNVTFYECGTALNINTGWDFHFNNCWWLMCGNGTSYPVIRMLDSSSDACNSMHFIGCRWENNYGYGIYSDLSGGGITNTAITLVGCKAQLYTVGGGYSLIYGQFFSLQVTGSFITSDGSYTALNLPGSSVVTIVGNTFQSAGAGVYSIYVNQGFIVIEGNVFVYHAGSGTQYDIYLAAGTNNTIVTGNTAYANNTSWALVNPNYPTGVGNIVQYNATVN